MPSSSRQKHRTWGRVTLNKFQHGHCDRRQFLALSCGTLLAPFGYVSFEDRLLQLFENLAVEMRQGFARMEARQDRMEARLDTMEARLDRMEARQNRMEARLDIIDVRLDSIDVRLNSMDVRLNSMDVRLDGMDVRLDGIDGRLNGMDARFDQVDVWLARADVQMREGLARVDQRFDDVIHHVSRVYEEHGSRLTDIEAGRSSAGL